MSASSELFGGGGSTPKKWVTGTNYTEGMVVWSPTDYQYYMRKTTGAGATDPASDSANWQPTGDRAIKSIQRGTLSISSNTTTVTISSVVVAKTELRFLGFTTSGTDNTHSVRIDLTNSTTITATQSAGGVSGAVSWELTERF